jgi:hypothetical protein
MATDGPSLVERLTKFVERWHDYQSTEMAGAQSYCQSLLECYGKLDYEPGTLFEQHPIKVLENGREQKDLFDNGPAKMKVERMDMYIPRVCVWEMKGPQENLDKHYDQLLRYWSYTRTRYMVLCNFHQIRVWDTDQPNGQVHPLWTLSLSDLPQQPEALAFLRGDEIFFEKKSEEITKDVARHIGRSVRELLLASDNPQRDRERITKFALECVFAMFGEDSGLIPGKLFQHAMHKAHSTGDLSPVYSLFDDFGRENEFDRANSSAPYINGPLFDRNHPKLAVNKSILGSINMAATEFDWTYVRPEVFGSIFEQAFLPHERHELGAHFTSEEDIMKVVGPTVVRPWRERIAACKTFRDCEALIERMQHYHVLDPACGSGNFLYVVYREMKRLEIALRNKHQELYKHKVSKRKSDMIPPPKGPYFTVQQLHGIDKDELAVQLSRVVIWIGQHLASLETEEEENVLPLRNLSDNIVKADALFTDWFRPTDDGVSELAIVGNPPYIGQYKQRDELGHDYVDRIHAAYPANRNADFVTYWYTKALQIMRKGERAGFVSTKTISQNENRAASLLPLVEKGGTIIDAHSAYPWPGEAVLHIAIICWIMDTYSGVIKLDGNIVSNISPQLKSEVDVTRAAKIKSNNKISFKGVEPGVTEFVLDNRTATEFLSKRIENSAVVKEFIGARDLKSDTVYTTDRYIIDFTFLDGDEIKKFSDVYNYAHSTVHPAKVNNPKKSEREKRRWWLYRTEVLEMRKQLQGMDKYIAISRHSPAAVFTFLDANVVPDSGITVITYSDNYHFGVMQSSIHEAWSWARCSTLKSDLRYTNTTIFETFPFPLTDCTDPFAGNAEPTARELLAKYDPRTVPDTDSARQLSSVAEELYEKRQAACKTLGLGLTKLYNFIKGKQKLTDLRADHQEIVKELQSLHEALNTAACRCYGWPDDTWRDENDVLSRLLRLNLALTEG